MHEASKHLAVITPVFNDWPSLCMLISKLESVAKTLPCKTSIIIINDGSTIDFNDSKIPQFSHFRKIVLVDLFCNVGHQRAIAVGVSLAVNDDTYSTVVVMDSDGEDSPEDLPKLYASHEQNPKSIVVAHRKKRSENFLFRTFYLIYKNLFVFLTGKTIDFGNFCILPTDLAKRIVYSPECWNHLAASIVKSRIPLFKLPTTRGKRYDGRSSMSLISLILHGFSSLAVFSETVLTRLLLVVGATASFSILLAIIAATIRFFTNLAIPGWTTNVALLSLLLLFQAGIVFVILISGNLSNRSIQPFIAAIDSRRFCRKETIIEPNKTHGKL